ncbi:MAG: hypothetical protein KAV87_35700 [Desulfobacteraceae bacterium]|nr:hypothetical protein [Desulfobacteraceae bacterium]
MKLNKIYKLEIQLPEEKNEPGKFLVILPPITVEFNIERRNKTFSGKANIKIYNLSEKNRSRIFRDRTEKFDLARAISTTNQPRDLRLYAGYESDGENLSLIFKGPVYEAHSRRRGPEYVTELECTDLNSYQYSKISTHSLDKNLAKRDVIKKLYTDLVGSEIAATGIIGGFSGIAKRGQVLMDPTIKLLREATDGNFYIDNGRPIAMLPEETFDNPDLPILSADSGLLNVPKRSGTRVVAQMMFTPNLAIGQKIVVNGYKDTQYNSVYKILGIRHSGIISGTHDAQTTTTVTLWNGATFQSIPIVGGLR